MKYKPEEYVAAVRLDYLTGGEWQHAMDPDPREQEKVDNLLKGLSDSPERIEEYLLHNWSSVERDLPKQALEDIVSYWDFTNDGRELGMAAEPAIEYGKEKDFSDALKPSEVFLLDPMIESGHANFGLDGTGGLIEAANSIREAEGMTDLLDLDPDNPVFYTFFLDADAEKGIVSLSFTANETELDDYENYNIPISDEKSKELFRTVLDQIKVVNERKPSQELVEFLAAAEKKPILYVPVGIPGSGKSTWAQKQAMPVHSSDQVRRDFEAQGITDYDNAMVFAKVREGVAADLAAGESCIYDATNLTEWERKDRISQCPGNVRKVAVMFDTPIEVCMERNSKREGPARVPDDIIRSMAKKFEPITDKEGFDDVIRVPWNRYLEIGYSVQDIKKQHAQIIAPKETPSIKKAREV